MQQKAKSREELVEQYIKENVKYLPDQERVRQYANSLGLNPYLDEIVYSSIWDKRNNCYARGVLIIPFDIVLAKAWDTGVFLGVDTEEIYEKNNLICVKAVGKRNVNGQIATISFNAYMKEYRPKNSNGFSPWIGMPTVMLRKCAISNVVRQLFADRLKLPYISEEMEQAYDNQNNINTTDLKDVPKGEHQKVTENKQEIANEEKAQKSLEWVVEFYNILVEKGEESLSDKQIDLILKATDKNLPNVKNSPIKEMLLGLSLYYSTSGGVDNPLDDRSPNMNPIDDYPDDMFVDNPFISGEKPEQ